MENKQKHSQPAEEVIKVLDLYETQDKIYTRKLKGFFRDIKKYTLIPMMSAYFLLPWFTIDGRQAIWFDLAERKFHILWLTFWPQDFMFLAWLLIISAFALFAVTVLIGRVWCGFSCPQTVWTLWFMNAEHFWEGDRNQRIKLDSTPWNANKIIRKSGKHLSWLLIAFVTGITFVGYFNPIRELVIDFFTFQTNLGAVFWIAFFTLMTYLNAGFLREQVCLYMCPYARFQSVMFDKDTLVVSYNKQRGEARGARKKTQDYKTEGLGDCVDCSLCVQVCPTGIDIRDGLQYECISCGLCVDACNAVMDKMGYDRNLISFTTEHNISGKKTVILRPRLIGYIVALLLMVILFVYAIATRIPLEADVIRDRSLLFRETPDGLVENIYTLKIANMENVAQQYKIEVVSEHDFIYKGDSQILVEGGEVYTLLVRLQLRPELLNKSYTTLQFTITALDDSTIRTVEESRFISSRAR